MYRAYSSSLVDSRPFLDIEAQIRGLTQDFITAFNTGNYDQGAAMFAPDGVFMAPHHEPAQGPKAVERLLRELADENAYQRYLSREGRTHSGEAWREFCDQRLSAKYMRSKCC